MAQNPTIDQLVKMLADQQKMVQDQSQQIAQLIAIRQNAPNAAAQPNQGANFRFVFFLDTDEPLPLKLRFINELNAFIPPPPKLNGERISPQAPF
ncbi:hypothetical protein niasHT_020403 [Heterodera trifolii]|uniref:Uncharacterized protein n=1 Tax=Heterodera trifolii TaxID=157864 RepID=A0ABD2JX88_9BILA